MWGSPQQQRMSHKCRRKQAEKVAGSIVLAGRVRGGKAVDMCQEYRNSLTEKKIRLLGTLLSSPGLKLCTLRELKGFYP